MKITEKMELAVKAIANASDCKKPYIQNTGRILLDEIQKQLPFADPSYLQNCATDIARVLTASDRNTRKAISRKMFIATQTATSQQ